MIQIVGTGNCGTGYVAHVLSSAGVKCTHEGVFGVRGKEFAWEQLRLRSANPDWGWVADSSWLAFPFLEELGANWEVAIVHLVRDPKKVIDSMLRQAHWLVESPHYDWGAARLPRVLATNIPEEQAAYWYVDINRVVELHADVFHRVEDDPRLLLDALGVDYRGRELFGDTAYNHHHGHRTSDIDLETLPEPIRSELREMAARYGY